MSGAGTILWKELREVYLRKGKPGRATWSALIFILFAGIGLPVGLLVLNDRFQGDPTAAGLGLAGIGTLFGLLAGYFTPLALAVDLTAGERERHTLETLLAGPLSDRSIWWGKHLTILVAASVQAAATAFLMAVTSIILIGSHGLPVLLAVAGAPLAASLLALPIGAIGIAIGSKAATVKAGVQTMSLVLMPFFFLAQFSLAAFSVVVRNLADRFPTSLSFIVVAIGGVVAIYLLLTLGALAWADRRFRRARLMQVKL